MKTLLPERAATVAAIAPALNAALLPEANVFVGQVVSACSSGTSIASSQVSIEELHRGAECIRCAIGWDDLVEVNTIHAFLDKKKHVTWEDAIVEEKRRRDEAELDVGPSDATSPRVTRRRAGDIVADVPSSSCVPPPPPGPMEDVRCDVSAKGRGQKATVQEKNKAPAYKLAVDIEATTDLKAILEKGILDARVEFSLRDILAIAKREFHDLIIDVIKRKRQTIVEQVVSQMAHVAEDTNADTSYDAAISLGELGMKEEEYVALVAGPATVEAADDDEKRGLAQSSDYQNEF
ncbi:hypothetical protein R1flu_002925 [Riccia fluitans]|uniref:Uncharacterized protein n=1 Tax=Riccia fluitans TaxID=41844 RepID=A0ABD1Y7N8_9MARC